MSLEENETDSFSSIQLQKNCYRNEFHLKKPFEENDNYNFL